MKIYIVNVPPSSIHLDKLTNINNPQNQQNMLVKMKYISEIVSENMGIIILDESTDHAYRLEPNFNTKYDVIKQYTTIDNKTNNTTTKNPIYYDLLLDNSKETRVQVTSQFPTEYVLTNITQYEYKWTKQSVLKLIVSCVGDIITDYYFIYKKDGVAFDIKDINVQSELNRFIEVMC